MDLQQYKLQDFLEDKSFQNWALGHNQEDSDFWDSWIRKHPRKKKLAFEAAQIIKGLATKEKQFSYSEIHTFWHELEGRLQTQESSRLNSETQAQRPAYLQTLLKTAAVFAGFIMLAGALWMYMGQSDMVTHATAYGETKTVSLPDGSQVMLNGNSELTYSSEWEAQASREVRLQGEAFFEVREIAAKQSGEQGKDFVKFTVHTSSLDIEVVGTAFNVNDRRNETTVVLESGKIKLRGDWLGEAYGDRVMEPGEMVEASREEKKLNKKIVNPTDYSAWRHNKLIFDNSTIAEIAQKLEDSYGLKVVVDHPDMWRNQFTGSASADRPDILFKAVAASFGWEAEQKGRVIYFHQP